LYYNNLLFLVQFEFILALRRKSHGFSMENFDFLVHYVDYWILQMFAFFLGWIS
jgi:hypothetical protein